MTDDHGEDSLFDRIEDLRREEIRRWINIRQTDADVDGVLEEVESFDLMKELVDSPPSPKEYSPAEEFALIIKSFEHSLFDDRDSKAALLTLVASSYPVLRKLHYYLQSINEYSRYKPFIDVLYSYNERQLDQAYEFHFEFRNSKHGLAVQQNHRYLANEVLEGDTVIEIGDPQSANKGVDAFRKCMEICDTGFAQYMVHKQISEGTDPSGKNFQSMNFGAVRNQLREHSAIRPIVEAIDKDLRNAISHGDLIVNVIDGCFEISEDDQVYSFSEFEQALTKALGAARFTTSLGNVVLYLQAAEKSGFRVELDDRIL